MQYGERIKHFRKLRGLSQGQIAIRLGITQSAVSQWEKNRTQPDPDQLIALVDLLGVSMDELLGRPVVISATTEQPIPQLDPEEQILVENFRLLNASGKAALMATIAGLLDNPAFRQDASTSSSNA